MLGLVKSLIKKLPRINRLVADRDALHLKIAEVHAQRDYLQEQLSGFLEQRDSSKDAIIPKWGKMNATLIEAQENLKKQGFVPPGHFYSPVPDFDEIKKNEQRIFNGIPDSVPGVELNEQSQLALLKHFVGYYKDMPFEAYQQEGLRYYFENSAYSYSDAILLHCMIREVKPQRIIEIGSGFSSCMTLDTNDLHFDGSIETTFIEPYPALLMSLLKEGDESRIKLIPTGLQDVELSEFDSLKANDILFIDSTHVSKIDSDVNRILFDILPRLASGVYIHFHDIFFPFEYPREWVFEGRAWNEAYILKAFLQYNKSFSVVLMNSYIAHFHKDFFESNLPLCLTNTGSIWLRKE